MFDAFRNHLSDRIPFLQGKQLLLASSGGIDSMVLADLLLKSGFGFALAHCNFSLRGTESDGDENFLREYAAKNNIAFYAQRFDTETFAQDNRLSIQMAARELRYAWFHELLEENGYDFLLTAHHADDNLETFIINLSRGTGLDGLAGIPETNGKILRPLLGFSRADIEKYASENRIGWREDSSNASDKYLRNKIRHEVVPALKSLNPDFLKSFRQTSEHLQQSKSLVRDAANLVYKQVAIESEDKVIFKLYELKRLPNYSAYLYEWLHGFGFTAWEDIYDLPDAQSGKQIFSNEFKLLKDREVIVLTPIKDENPDENFFVQKGQQQLAAPVNLAFCRVTDIGQSSDNRIFVDEDRLEFPLTVRKWREGDYFFPFGMTGKKKISKFFKDEKFSLIDKAETWLLCSGSEIIWIIGKRMDDRFKINNTTKNILEIKLQ